MLELPGVQDLCAGGVKHKQLAALSAKDKTAHGILLHISATDAIEIQLTQGAPCCSGGYYTPQMRLCSKHMCYLRSR